MQEVQAHVVFAIMCLGGVTPQCVVDTDKLILLVLVTIHMSMR